MPEPDLAFVNLGPGEEGLPNAFDFTWNSQKVLAEGDAYYNCLYEKYNKSRMPAFPQLTREEMTALYDYIENESHARGIPFPIDRQVCYDSCENYFREKENLEGERESSTAVIGKEKVFLNICRFCAINNGSMK